MTTAKTNTNTDGKTAAPVLGGASMMISIVTPAYNEEKNLPPLAAELLPVLNGIGMEWEWLILDDHSSDNTFAVASKMAKDDSRIRCARMATNSGSHSLILFGLQQARGDCAVFLAADMQDPPAALPELVQAMQRQNAHIVWRTRTKRDDPLMKTLFAKLYYFVIRRIFGLRGIPARGADMVLLRRRVLDELKNISGENINILTLIAQMGFRQAHIAGERRPRLSGKGNFTFGKNIKLFFDTITAHTAAPLRWITALGFFTSFVGVLYALFIIIVKVRGAPVEGWSSLMIVILVLGGVQMTMLGVIGEYLWRSLGQERRASPRIVEESTDNWHNKS